MLKTQSASVTRYLGNVKFHPNSYSTKSQMTFLSQSSSTSHLGPNTSPDMCAQQLVMRSRFSTILFGECDRFLRPSKHRNQTVLHDTSLPTCIYFATQHGDLCHTYSVFALRVVFVHQNTRSLRKKLEQLYCTMLRQRHILCGIT